MVVVEAVVVVVENRVKRMNREVIKYQISSIKTTSTYIRIRIGRETGNSSTLSG